MLALEGVLAYLGWSAIRALDVLGPTDAKEVTRIRDLAPLVYALVIESVFFGLAASTLAFAVMLRKRPRLFKLRFGRDCGCAHRAFSEAVGTAGLLSALLPMLLVDAATRKYAQCSLTCRSAGLRAPLRGFGSTGAGYLQR